jgi:membrane dipeptidase
MSPPPCIKIDFTREIGKWFFHWSVLLNPIASARRLAIQSALGCAAPALGRFARSGSPAKSKGIVLSEKALRIHRAAIVVDGHNDLPYHMRAKGLSSLEGIDLASPQPEFHTDIPRLVKGGAGAQFWAADQTKAPAKEAPRE